MKPSILSAASFTSLAFTQRPSAAITTETVYSCPSTLTEYLTFTIALVPNSTETQAVGVPTTTTDIAVQPMPTTTTKVDYQAVTIVQTVTTTVFNVSTIIPPPVTQTSITSTTTSETLYPIISIWTTTEEVTSLTVCPTRTLNPTYTAQFPLPTEYTWGCPPGYLCKPDQIDCNFEAGLPAENFYCSPDQCIAAAALGVPQEWDTTIYGNSSPATDPNLRFNVIDHYFNMNPQDYGLTYEIFVQDEAFTFTSTIGYAPTPTLAVRQAETSVPGACYPWCNNCLLEAQSVGKTPSLCKPNSTYEKDLADCQQCIAYHASDNSGSFVQIAPQFQQFMAYCNALSAPPPPATSPVTIYSTSTLTVQPDLSLSSTATITYLTTSRSKASSFSSTTTALFTSTTISQVVSPVQTATSSSTEWLVPSGSTTIVFTSSPAVTTQWTMTSNSSTIIFASSPIISASVIMYGPNTTISTLPLLTTSTTSATTSRAVSSTIVNPTSVATSSSSATSSITSTSTSPASSTFTGAASRNALLENGGGNSLFSILCAVLLVVVGD